MIAKDFRTRYFIFTKVNPTGDDIATLVRGCESIKAEFYGYHVHGNKERKILKGFLVLSQDTTLASRLYAWFPNFLVSSMPTEMGAEFDNMPEGVIVTGNHPYSDCRKNLFKSDFHHFFS